MPKLKKPQKAFSEITALIAGEMATQEVNYCDIAGCCCMTPQTLARKVKDPRRFTLGELTGLCKVLCIAPDKLRNAIYY